MLSEVVLPVESEKSASSLLTESGESVSSLLAEPGESVSSLLVELELSASFPLSAELEESGSP